jgi:hypothetical protein
MTSLFMMDHHFSSLQSDDLCFDNAVTLGEFWEPLLSNEIIIIILTYIVLLPCRALNNANDLIKRHTTIQDVTW